MLNLVQHLTKSRTYETLKQVQGDRLGLFTSSPFVWSTKKITIEKIKQRLVPLYKEEGLQCVSMR